MMVQEDMAVEVPEEEAYGLFLERVDEGYIGLRNAVEDYVEEINGADAGEYAVLEIEMDVFEVLTDEVDDILLGVQHEYGVSPNELSDEELDETMREYAEEHGIDESVLDDPVEPCVEIWQHDTYSSGTADGEPMNADADIHVRQEGGETAYVDDVFHDVRDEIADRAAD